MKVALFILSISIVRLYHIHMLAISCIQTNVPRSDVTTKPGHINWPLRHCKVLTMVNAKKDTLKINNIFQWTFYLGKFKVTLDSLSLIYGCLFIINFGFD